MKYGYFDEENKEYVVILPEYQGLRISPCIPGEWKGFEVVRHFRGAIYEIKVTNPHRASMGINSIFIDGKKIEGNILPLLKTATTHKVELILGGVNAR